MDAALRKDYIWNTLGTSANAFISLLLLIAVTRLNGIADSGLFSFCFSYAIVFYTIGLYGGRIYQVSDVAGEFESRAYVAVKFLTSLGMLVAAALFILVNGYTHDRAVLLLSLTIYKILDAIADPLYGVLQRRGALWAAGASLTLKAAVGFVAFVCVDVLTDNLILASYALLAANVLFLLVWDLPRTHRLERIAGVFQRNNVAPSLRLLRRASWIFVFALLTTLLANIPRYFVDRWHPDDLGWYGIVIMPATLLNLFVTFLIYPKLVPLSERFARGEHVSFGRTVTKFFLVSLAFGAVATGAMWLIGCPVLSFIYGVDLSAYRAALTLVTLGGALNTVTLICTNILSIMRRFPAQLVCYLAGTAAIAGCSVAFVREGSVAGGVLAFLVSNGVQAILFFVSYRYGTKMQTDSGSATSKRP